MVAQALMGGMDYKMGSLANYNDFFITLFTSLLIFLAGFLIIGAVIYFLFRNFLRGIFISEEEVSKLKALSRIEVHKISVQKPSKTAGLKDSYKSGALRNRALLKKVSLILFVIIIGAFLLNQFLMWRMNSFGILNKLLNINITVTKR